MSRTEVEALNARIAQHAVDYRDKAAAMSTARESSFEGNREERIAEFTELAVYFEGLGQ